MTDVLKQYPAQARAIWELQRLEAHMRGLRIDQDLHWSYFHRSKANVLEQSGQPGAALDLIREVGEEHFRKADVRRLKEKVR